eukprot:TRINITY_DN65790_c6_g1_i1.p1 TRINITY_DN65790_c6_g1~~TRINITY_DN65790_c6_g1_i1.p1  ORF type:complete len:350 (+),score=163.16 TRINITY_DN65790_c6_g1_i1:100-1149(+)
MEIERDHDGDDRIVLVGDAFGPDDPVPKPKEQLQQQQGQQQQLEQDQQQPASEQQRVLERTRRKLLREQERVAEAVDETKRLAKRLAVQPTQSERAWMAVALTSRLCLTATSILAALYLDDVVPELPLYIVVWPILMFNAAFLPRIVRQSFGRWRWHVRRVLARAMMPRRYAVLLICWHTVAALLRMLAHPIGIAILQSTLVVSRVLAWTEARWVLILMPLLLIAGALAGALLLLLSMACTVHAIACCSTRVRVWAVMHLRWIYGHGSRRRWVPVVALLILGASSSLFAALLLSARKLDGLYTSVGWVNVGVACVVAVVCILQIIVVSWRHSIRKRRRFANDSWRIRAT